MRFISPRIALLKGQLVKLRVSAGIAISNDLNGIQSDPDVGIVTGLSVSF
jgi:hypothetical protein